ncbi:MAG TPA: DUF4350 domain-containing protein [Candidatus Limnocylindrales bacterium]|jgi:hypothetical protein|nr:DUF4350 domain-containing protein [Candidatus Limnocylindrales bacterium]
MSRWPIIVLLACGGLFALGVLQLFRVRYAAGDVYPEYSSLRSDPLGTMMLFEALETMGSLTVKRDFSDANNLPPGSGTTYLHLASSAAEWGPMPEEAVKEIERFLRNGGRLVITFLPETSPLSWITSGKVSPPVPARRNKSKSPQKKTVKRSPLQESLGVEFERLSFSSGELRSNSVQVLNQNGMSLPSPLAWHSPIIFTNLDAAWQTIYARGTNPVVIERQFGAGSVVMSSDSYFISNEALRKERHADLLAWLIGPGKQVMFDEAHLGIVESGNVTSLMRKYRLGAMAAALLLLALLFVWKNTATFGPPAMPLKVGSFIKGRESADGLVNLLRRNVVPRDLLSLCFEEWTKSLGAGTSYPIARVDRAQSVIEAENKRAQTQRDPVRAYIEICRALEGDGAGPAADGRVKEPEPKMS